MNMREWLSSGAGLAGHAPVLRAGGPILDKELRVAGRRRLTYLVRVIYVAVMALFVVGTWWSEVGTLAWTQPIERQMRMAAVGQHAIFALLWFQFVALQLVAAVLLAGAIGDEVVRRTLDVLLATPITARQIVAGKLASRLLALLLLAALSLPVMLVIRVLGGVSAGSVLGGISVTLTAALFVASLSLYFSAGDRRPWLVIVKVAGVYIALFAALPIITTILILVGSGGRGPPGTGCFELMAYANPVMAMFMATADLMRAPFPGSFTFFWPVHCGLMVLASAILWAATVKRVTRVALQQMISPGAAGAAAAAPPVATWLTPEGRAVRAAVGPAIMAPIRRVRGAPMIWKEVRHRVFSNPAVGCALVGLMVLALMGTYMLILMVDHRFFLENDFHIAYAVVLVLMGSIGTTILAAAPIASEKEARTWGVLVATPLTEREILLGKAAGVWRRSIPVWCPLFAHLCVFLPFGLVHPIVILHIAIIVFGIVMLVTGTGLYFSAALRTGTRAVLANLGLHGLLWAAAPAAVAGISEFFGYLRYSGGVHLTDMILFVNPVVQAGVVTQWTGRRAWVATVYVWSAFGSNRWDVSLATLAVLLTAAAFSLIGLGFAKLAARRIRAEKA